MATSPTQLSLKRLRELGYEAAVVEKWNPHAKIRQDLFGCIDILALDESGRSIWVQTTSASNMAARRTKLKANDILPRLAMRGKVLLHGWKKVNGRWLCKEEEIAVV
jgi:hypothetical protein